MLLSYVTSLLIFATLNTLIFLLNHVILDKARIVIFTILIYRVIKRIIMAKEALQNVGDIIKRLGDGKVAGNYYPEFSRRLEVLRLVG